MSNASVYLWRTAFKLTVLSAFGLASAQASVIFNFAYSYAGVTSSGQFVTTDNLNGTFLVTGVSGERNGVVIASLLPVGTGGLTSNLLYPANAIPVDFPGVSYQLTDGMQINLYNSPSQGNVREYVNFNTELPVGGAFALVLTEQAVPEPLTSGLVGAGLLVLLFARLRARDPRVD